MKSKSFVTLLFVIAILLLLTPFTVQAAAPAQESTPPPVTVPEGVLLLIPVLVGSIGIPIINWLKKSLKWTSPEDKLKNVWLSFVISVLLAILALLLTNSFLPITGPETIVTWITLAFTVATLIYKSMQPATESQNSG